MPACIFLVEQQISKPLFLFLFPLLRFFSSLYHPHPLKAQPPPSLSQKCLVFTAKLPRSPKHLQTPPPPRPNRHNPAHHRASPPLSGSGSGSGSSNSVAWTLMLMLMLMLQQLWIANEPRHEIPHRAAGQRDGRDREQHLAYRRAGDGAGA